MANSLRDERDKLTRLRGQLAIAARDRETK